MQLRRKRTLLSDQCTLCCTLTALGIAVRIASPHHVLDAFRQRISLSSAARLLVQQPMQHSVDHQPLLSWVAGREGRRLFLAFDALSAVVLEVSVAYPVSNDSCDIRSLTERLTVDRQPCRRLDVPTAARHRYITDSDAVATVTPRGLCRGRRRESRCWRRGGEWMRGDSGRVGGLGWRCWRGVRG